MKHSTSIPYGYNIIMKFVFWSPFFEKKIFSSFAIWIILGFIHHIMVKLQKAQNNDNNIIKTQQ